MSFGIKQKIKYQNLNIIQITPAESLGRILDFNHEGVQRNLKLGYYVAQRYLEGLIGYQYYIEPFNEEKVVAFLSNLSVDEIDTLRKIIRIDSIPSHRMLFEKMLPKSAVWLRVDAAASYRNIAIKLLEPMA